MRTGGWGGPKIGKNAYEINGRPHVYLMIIASNVIRINKLIVILYNIVDFGNVLHVLVHHAKDQLPRALPGSLSVLASRRLQDKQQQGF